VFTGAFEVVPDRGKLVGKVGTFGVCGGVTLDIGPIAAPTTPVLLSTVPTWGKVVPDGLATLEVGADTPN